jgi:hypothetical protein
MGDNFSRHKLLFKTCIFASLFLWAISNIFIQMVFPNIIKFVDRTDEQNDIILLNFRSF